MNSKVMLDRAGRVVLPKAFRDAMQLSPGDALDLELEGDKVTMRPRRGTAPLHKERGIWVLRTGQSLGAGETDEVLRNQRQRRGRPNSGAGG
jgi:AbrB family looped-hinge helix DNA binding protein